MENVEPAPAIAQPPANTIPDSNPINNWKKLKYCWHADLYRYTGRTGKVRYLQALWRNPGYRHTYYMRWCSYLAPNRANVLKNIAFRFFFEILRHYSLEYGLEITYLSKIGPGLYLPHPQGIVVHEDAVIGRNCLLSQGVTIGDLKRGARQGCPVIGNNVYIAPGAVVAGNIKVGNNVAIGANAVVNHDLPDNAVAAGVPAKIISFKGAGEYITRVDY
jgi:serine O-acetyltransferase